jgi:hypothetical protein
MISQTMPKLNGRGSLKTIPISKNIIARAEKGNVDLKSFMIVSFEP